MPVPKSVLTDRADRNTNAAESNAFSDQSTQFPALLPACKCIEDFLPSFRYVPFFARKCPCRTIPHAEITTLTFTLQYRFPAIIDRMAKEHTHQSHPWTILASDKQTTLADPTQTRPRGNHFMRKIQTQGPVEMLIPVSRGQTRRNINRFDPVTTEFSFDPLCDFGKFGIDCLIQSVIVCVGTGLDRIDHQIIHPAPNDDPKTIKCVFWRQKIPQISVANQVVLAVKQAFTDYFSYSHFFQ